ncbi:MAG: hypothetical protein RSC52_05200 [Oscillospiraceae bacterium]
MNKLRKRMLSLILTAVMLFGIAPALTLPASAVTETEVTNSATLKPMLKGTTAEYITPDLKEQSITGAECVTLITVAKPLPLHQALRKYIGAR